ncbi:MAG TPA: YciI family protein [Ktedonobacterales bacterium]|nr:YciI family protein [Ktedonobacterales bacterium]
MARFMLLLHSAAEEREQWRSFTPEQVQRAMQRYYDWVAQLRREGRMLGGDPLKDDGLVLRLRNGEPVVDGPYAETKESIGGVLPDRGAQPRGGRRGGEGLPRAPAQRLG